MDLIHLDNLCDSLQARPGVVVGDGITTIPGQFRDILEKVLLEIGEHVEHSGGKTLGELADAAKILSENHYDSVKNIVVDELKNCLLYTSPSPRDRQKSRMPSSA